MGTSGVVINLFQSLQTNPKAYFAVRKHVFKYETRNPKPLNPKPYMFKHIRADALSPKERQRFYMCSLFRVPGLFLWLERFGGFWGILEGSKDVRSSEGFGACLESCAA